VAQGDGGNGGDDEDETARVFQHADEGLEALVALGAVFHLGVDGAGEEVLEAVDVVLFDADQEVFRFDFRYLSEVLPAVAVEDFHVKEFDRFPADNGFFRRVFFCQLLAFPRVLRRYFSDLHSQRRILAEGLRSVNKGRLQAAGCRKG